MNSITSINQPQQSNQQKYKKPNILTCITGIMAGNAVSSIIQIPHKKIVVKNVVENLQKINTLTDDELKLSYKAIDSIITKSGLADKGVEVLRNTAENADKISDAIKATVDASLYKRMPKFYKDSIENTFKELLNSGKNSLYLSKLNKILIPQKDIALLTFHEIGHAASANLSKLGKTLSKSSRIFRFAIPIISTIALYKTKKAPDDKPKGFLGKATEFIKNNAGKLTFLACVPTLADEAIASIKGYKLAKSIDVLNPDLLKKVARTNRVAFLSYISSTVLASLGIFAAVKVKDSIAKPKPIN